MGLADPLHGGIVGHADAVRRHASADQTIEFGNDGIELDGVVGSRTRAAIKEFQTLFGLPVTGEPDEALYAKMRETGLTN